MILVLFFLFSALAAFCGLLICGYRHRAHSAEARANRAEGALGEAQKRADGMTEIAREAIKISATVAKLNPDDVLPRNFVVKADGTTEGTPPEYLNSIRDGERVVWERQTVAFCPSCNVSVRHPPEAYPVNCPACKTLIDPVLDNPPEFDSTN